MTVGGYIAIAVFVVAAAIVVWNHLRQRRLIKELQEMTRSLEESKRHIVLEQERNRQLKQEMTSNIAHELKTPVSSIRGYLEILLGERPVDEERRRYFLERCYSHTLRLSDLINDVSLINKIEESSKLFPTEELSVTAIAAEAVAELDEQCKSHDITVHNRLPEPMLMMGNSSLIYSIFRNLLENAVNYAGDGVEVFVESYKRDDERFYIHFYDTGKGVGNAYLPKLFDRFLRIDEGRSRRTGGTGLGLSIVKHAVLFHGGEIYVRNREAGGLEFFFSLKKK